jgi:hypothetical protein
MLAFVYVLLAVLSLHLLLLLPSIDAESSKLLEDDDEREFWEIDFSK